MGNQRRLLEEGRAQRPYGEHPDRVKVQSTPLNKYWETKGRKDREGSGSITGYQESVFEQFSNWNDRWNYDAAKVVSDLTVVSKPANPTKASVPSGYRLQRYDSSIGAWTTLTYMPFNWYDCTTWANYYQLNGQQYWGYKESVKGSVNNGPEKTVTVLVQEK